MRVPELVAAASAEEPAQLRRYRPLPLRRLALEDPERREFALGGDDAEYGIDPKATEGLERGLLRNDTLATTYRQWLTEQQRVA